MPHLPDSVHKIVVLSSPAPVLVAEAIELQYVAGVQHGHSSKIGLAQIEQTCSNCTVEGGDLCFFDSKNIKSKFFWIQKLPENKIWPVKVKGQKYL